MASRTIQAPGIQVNEIDRSLYGQVVDNSLPNSPNCFILGFADKGDDYTIRSIPSREDLTEIYGYPLNEPERYFYNACIEVLDRGAKLLTAKLPYDNNSKDKFSYVDYTIDPHLYKIITNTLIAGKWNTISDIRDVLLAVIERIKTLQVDNAISSEIVPNAIPVVETIQDMRTVVNNIIEAPEFLNLKDRFSDSDARTQDTLKERFINKDDGFYHFIIENDNKDINAGKHIKDLFDSILTSINSNLNLTATPIDNTLFTALDVDEFFTAVKYYYLNTDRKIQITIDLSLLTTFVDITPLYELCNEYFSTSRGKEFKTLLEDMNLHSSVETVQALRDSIRAIVNSLNDNNPYVDLRFNDSYMTSYCLIVPDLDSKTGQAKSGLMTIDDLDDLLTNDYTKVQDKIRIVDITRHQYEPVYWNCVKSTLYENDNAKTNPYSVYTNECLGIVPVVVAPTNALYFQNMIQEANNKDYNCIAEFNTTMTDNPDIMLELNKNDIYENLYVDLKNSSTDLPSKETLSKMVADCFPLIEYENHLHYDLEHFKKIGIVVLSAFIDLANNNKLNFKVLESFVGSLDKQAKSITDNSSIFIDNIINNNSNYIRCFSAANLKTLRESSIVALKNQTATSLGFYKLDCDKNIHITNSIITPLTHILDNMRDTRGYQVDLIVDAGLTNIGQYLQGKDTTYSSLLTFNSRPYFWFKIATMFDNFCKLTRKDCMYLLDCPRPFCLEGEQKIVRRSKPTNTILKDIVPKLKYMTGIDSSYTAGYCNWFKVRDDFSGDVFWCPPSIKAMGIYCYTDVYYHKWDAPAGMNRGRLLNVIDTAFSPTNEEAGRMYTQCWNYAVNYPYDGIVIEGQRTFQRKLTALDRVNVRRLMLHLEKSTVNIAKYYLYEGHTEYLRERFKNALSPVFEDAINGYGISDYIIKCDEDNNPTIAIERNELHCTIAVKPIKAVEFIVLNFIVTNLSANVSEEVNR